MKYSSLNNNNIYIVDVRLHVALECTEVWKIWGQKTTRILLLKVRIFGFEITGDISYIGSRPQIFFCDFVL